jgi:phage baseplate assembly protein W
MVPLNKQQGLFYREGSFYGVTFPTSENVFPLERFPYNRENSRLMLAPNFNIINKLETLQRIKTPGRAHPPSHGCFISRYLDNPVSATQIPVRSSHDAALITCESVRTAIVTRSAVENHTGKINDIIIER